MFSVVIPTLNRSDKLRRALDNAAGQLDESPEIIVVDDGSTPDESARIAAHVAATPNARLIALPRNVGPAVARNVGVAAARGDVIAFLDSDDWWLPGRLARHRAAFADPAVVLTWNSALFARGDGSAPRGRVGRPQPRRWSRATALAGWNYIGGCSVVCVRRRAFDAAGGFDASLPSCEDWDLFLRLVEHGEFRFLDEDLGYFDVGPHPRLTTSQAKIIDGHARVHAFASTFPTTPAEKGYVAATHHWTMAEIHLLFGDGARCRAELARSLRTRPTAIALSRLPAMLARSLRARARARVD